MMEVLGIQSLQLERYIHFKMKNKPPLYKIFPDVPTGNWKEEYGTWEKFMEAVHKSTGIKPINYCKEKTN